MTNPVAAHGTTLVDRAVTSSAAVLVRLQAQLAAWQDARHLRALDARQRRDVGLTDLAVPRVAVQPGWDVRLQGLS